VKVKKTTKILIVLAVVLCLAFVIAFYNQGDSAPAPSTLGVSNSPSPASNVFKKVTTLTGRAAEIDTAADGVVKVQQAGGAGKFSVVVVVDNKDHKALDQSWKVQAARNFAEGADKVAYAAEQNIHQASLSWGARSYTANCAREKAKKKRDVANKAKAEYQRILREEGI